MLSNLIWKHHFCPIDTSNALIWLNVPTKLIALPKPTIAFHSLPLDLISRIFAFVVHSDCTRPEDRYKMEVWQSFVSSGSSPTSPLILGHVCRSWRNFVHNYPLLWATIFVHSPLPKHVSAVAFWLKRSGVCLLDLRLEQFLTPDPTSYAIANMFANEAHRWGRISFVLSIQYPWHNLNIGDTPLLEAFRIRLPRWDRAKTAHFVDVLLSSKMLHTINWGTSTFGNLPTMTPWKQLCEISFHNLELSNKVLHCLAHCDDLRSLSLYRINTQNGRFRDTSPITLPHLERLVCERSDYAIVFDYFTLPALHDLRIVTFLNMDNPEQRIKSLINMVERSACKLLTLDIDPSAVPILSSNIVDHLSSLRVLKFPSCQLPLLIVHPGEKVILPSLRNLFIGRYDAVDGTLGTLAWSRRDMLQTLRVGVDTLNFPLDVITLGQLKDCGMAVEVREPLYQSQVVSYTRFGSDVESDTKYDAHHTSTIRIPDFDTLWT